MQNTNPKGIPLTLEGFTNDLLSSIFTSTKVLDSVRTILPRMEEFNLTKSLAAEIMHQADLAYCFCVLLGMALDEGLLSRSRLCEIIQVKYGTTGVEKLEKKLDEYIEVWHAIKPSKVDLPFGKGPQ